MIDRFIDILVANPLILVFLIAAIGYPLGRIPIRGTSLGVASILFVGLAAGALHPDLRVPEVVYTLGLVISVYLSGLSSGPGFFAAFQQRDGLRDTLFVLLTLTIAGGLAVVAHLVLRLSPAHTAGLYAGSLANASALAGVLELLKAQAPTQSASVLADPVVAYSLSYPLGVFGVLITMLAAQRFWRVNFDAEEEHLRQLGLAHEQLVNSTIRITRPEAINVPLQELRKLYDLQVIFGRVRQNDRVNVVHEDTIFTFGNLVSVVGTAEGVDEAIRLLGERSEVNLDLDRREIDYRRIFVSNPRVVGHQLRVLNLPQQFGAVVTRVRRGDIELLPRGDTVLALGDRVRVVSRRENLPAISKFLGDSYNALSEIDIMTFSLGLTLGLLLGVFPIPLPGNVIFTFGLAGGPLMVGLLLGMLGRTGPLVWHLPYSANLTLRQIGLILFLAGIGTRAGHDFFALISQGYGLQSVVAGAAITCGTALIALAIGYRLLGIPMSVLMGIVAAIYTQPAALNFARLQTGNDTPTLGYARVYPIAVIAKVIGAQVLLHLLQR